MPALIGSRRAAVLAKRPSIVGGGSGVSGVMTLSGLSSAFQPFTVPSFGPNAPASLNIVVNKTITYQDFFGMGAALTDSSVYALVTYLTLAQRTDLFQDFFGAIQSPIVRLCMGTSDFSRNTNYYSYNDVDTDGSNTNFSVQKDIDRQIVQLALEILAVNPNTRFIAMPWSPPRFIKTNGTFSNGGQIIESPLNFTFLADYFVKFVQAYAALGIPIFAVAPQNEPNVGTKTYPCCAWSSAQLRNFIGTYLGPAFASAGLTTEIWTGDCAWGDTGTTVTTVLADATARSYTKGAAYHGYTGAPSKMSTDLASYPAVKAHLTEYRTLLSQSLDDAQAQIAGEYVLGGMQNGAQSVVMWNFALDQNGEPSGSNGRRAPVMVSNTGKGQVEKTPEYYIMKHLGQFVKRGAKRIAATSPAPGSKTGTDIETVAFQNSDGTTTVFVWNAASADKSITITDYVSGQVTGSFTIPARAMLTVTYSGLGSGGSTAVQLSGTFTGQGATNASLTGGSGGVLTQDALGSVAWTNYGSKAVSMTVSPNANLMVVALTFGISGSSGTDYPPSPVLDVNGTPMTLADMSLSTGSATRDRGVALYYLSNPPTGSVVVNIGIAQPVGAGTSFNCTATCVSYQNAAASPIGTVAKTATTSAGVNSVSLTTNSPKTTDIHMALLSIRSNTAPTPGSGQTNLNTNLSGTNQYGSVTTKPGGSGIVNSFTWTTADQAAELVVPIISAS